MYLQSLTTAVPATAYCQSELLEIFLHSQARHRLKERSQGLMEKILRADNGIETRHLAIENLEGIFDLDAESLNRAFECHAPRLAGEALRAGLDRAALRPADLDALFVCTCTGYLCPGVGSHVAEARGLRSDVYLQDLVGMGCGAAIPTLRAAHGFMRANPGARVATVAVEICSAAFYLDDDPGVLISACLFGDGAACAVFGPDAPGTGAWTPSSFDTVHCPRDRELLRFVNRQGKLRNQLHRSVPEVAAKAVRGLYDRYIQENGTSEHHPLAHPGGRDVVDALSAVFDDHAFPESRWILRHGGNLSSPSILFALASHLSQTDFRARVELPPSWIADRAPVERTVDTFWLTSFGAGFTAHGCTLNSGHKA